MKKITQMCFRFHQHLGLAISLGLIAWALSGLAHPIISRINPAAAAFAAPTLPLAHQFFDAEKVNQQFYKVDHLRIFNIGNGNLARIESDGETHYFSVENWQEQGSMDANYATFLARHFSGDQTSPITNIETITEFDDDYLAINKLLPVSRVSFDRPDQLRVYVDTQQGRLATLMDDNKAQAGRFFRALHTWHWWPESTTKTFVITLLLALIFLVLMMGLWLYLQRWRQGVFTSATIWPTSRRWHAHISGASAALALCFVVSGLLHFLVSKEMQKPERLSNSLQPTSFYIQDGQLDAQWVSQGNLGAWRIVQSIAHKTNKKQNTNSSHLHANHGVQANSQTEVVYQTADKRLTDAENQMALAMAQQWHKGEVTGIELQKGFSNDYGFINKRLPVVRVTYSDQTLLFIEPQTRTLAASTTAMDAFEGASFGYLHKWHMLDFLGKDIRDLLLGLTAMLVTLGAGMGIYRYCSKTKR